MSFLIQFLLRILHHLIRHPVRKVHSPALSCLLLAYPKLQAWCLPCLRCLRRRSVVLAGRGVSRRRALVLAWGGRRAAPCPLLVRRSRGAKIDSAQRQNVTDSQAGMQTDAHDERICRCHSRQTLPNLPVYHGCRCHYLPPSLPDFSRSAFRRASAPEPGAPGIAPPFDNPEKVKCQAELPAPRAYPQAAATAPQAHALRHAP